MAFASFGMTLKKWEMTEKCGKGLNFGGNVLDMWEMAEIYDQWLSCVRNGLNKKKMA